MHEPKPNLTIPDEFKKLTGQGAIVGEDWILRTVEGGYEVLNRVKVKWRQVAGTWLLIAGFGAGLFWLRDWRGIVSAPGFLPWLYYVGTLLLALGLLGFQVHRKRTSVPLLQIDDRQRRLHLPGYRPRVVPFDEVRRVHLASELLANHGDGGRYRSFELSLLVQVRPGDDLERIPLAAGFDRKAMLGISVCVQKAVGLRLGSPADRILDQELEAGVD